MDAIIYLTCVAHRHAFLLQHAFFYFEVNRITINHLFNMPLQSKPLARWYGSRLPYLIVLEVTIFFTPASTNKKLNCTTIWHIVPICTTMRSIEALQSSVGGFLYIKLKVYLSPSIWYTAVHQWPCVRPSHFSKYEKSNKKSIFTFGTIWSTEKLKI